MTANKLYIIAAALVLTVLVAIFLIWPKYQNFRGLNSIIKEKRAELQSEQDYFSHLREISQRLDDYKEPLLKIANALPKDPSLSSLLSFFQETSSGTGLLLEEVRFDGIQVSKKKSEKVKDINFIITLDGAYANLKNFLSVIESSARLIEVGKISFSIPEDPEEPLSFQLDIKAHSY